MTAFSSLTWGIKESLLRYIESLDDGDISVVMPASRAGDEFTFPLGETETDFDRASETGTLQFLGAVALTAYAGELAIRLSDPRLELAEGKGFLKVRQQSFFSDEPFLTLGSVTPLEAEGCLSFAFTLGAGGQSVFGPQYSVGQKLSPITVR